MENAFFLIGRPRSFHGQMAPISSLAHGSNELVYTRFVGRRASALRGRLAGFDRPMAPAYLPDGTLLSPSSMVIEIAHSGAVRQGIRQKGGRRTE